MSDQQDLIDRIVATAVAISLARHRYIDVQFDGAANQLRVAILKPTGKVDARYAIELHEPEEPEFAQRRVNRLLLEVLTHLETIQRQTSLTTQRSFGR